MTTRTATRGRATAPTPGAPGPRSPRWLTVALALTAVLAVLAGIWGVAAGRQTDRLAGAPVGTPVPGGVLRVDGLADREVDHSTMPGMSMPEDVPAGLRRVAVTATLTATGASALPYDERDFTVSGPGVQPVVPVRSEFRGGSLPAGSALTGMLTFDVPEDARVLDLRFREGDPVRLPELAPAAGHGEAGAPQPTGAGGGGTAPDDGHGH